MACKSEKIEWEVSYASSGELMDETLSHFIFSGRILKMNFIFSRVHVSFVAKTVNIGK